MPGLKTRTVVVPGVPDGDKNRDGGKIFFLTEMSSSEWFFWLMQVMQAIGRSGLETPQTMAELDPITAARIAFAALGKMHIEEARELVGRLLKCVKIIRNPQNPELKQDLMGPYGDQDILEVSTMFLLQSEVIDLHTGFSIAGLLSKSKSEETPAPKSKDSSSPPTSPASTPSSSGAA